MATCDPDGRIAEALADRMACLGMELDEHMRIATRRLEEELMPLLRQAQAEESVPKHYARWTQLLCLFGHRWQPGPDLGDRLLVMACARCVVLR